jgi:hypothetical protein
MALPEEAYPGDKMLPWGRRTRAVPLRTYTGDVKYKRKIHYFTVADATRVIDKVNWGGSAGQTDTQKILNFIKDLTLKMLEKILWFLDEDQVRSIYDWVYILLAKVFQVDTSYMLPNRDRMEDLIYQLAAKGRFEITIKRL